MNILALESSCDETACAIVTATKEDKLLVRANVISSQIEIHQQFGGVVPEVASRHHLQNIIPVIEQALSQASFDLSNIDAISVTRGPGLVGALLVAFQVGKTIAFARNLPWIGVHHLEGHLLAAYLSEPDAESAVPPMPHLSLLVSGGHTSLILVKDFCDYEVIGKTRDDAAGEAFDKVGKLLGFLYPAGPRIDRLSQAGDENALKLPKAMLGPKGGLDFSYSGLKTWMASYMQSTGPKPSLESICASFQAAVIEQLIRKTQLALKLHQVPAIVLSGGVASNRLLRQKMAQLCQQNNLAFYVPKPTYCTDNAAMIAAAGYFRLRRGERSPFSTQVQANLPLSTQDRSL